MSDIGFDPFAIFRVLQEQGVRFVVIGGVATGLRGAPDLTGDLDICYARDDENLDRLVAALRVLDARLRVARETEDVPFQLDAMSLKNGDSFTFRTNQGDFDILGTPSGTDGFGDLDRHADEFVLSHRLAVRVASVDDLIRMKRASGRTKDLLHLEHLAALREEIEAFRAAGLDPQQGDPS